MRPPNAPATAPTAADRMITQIREMSDEKNTNDTCTWWLFSTMNTSAMLATRTTPPTMAIWRT